MIFFYFVKYSPVQTRTL